MSWYYSTDGQQRGPVSEPDFQALVQSGVITPDTLVWQEGLPSWISYREAAAPPLTLSKAPLASAGAASSGGSDSIGLQTAEVVCVECHGSFPQNAVAFFGPNAVCGNCKPAFFQKMREGVAPSYDRKYGGFWIRVLAKILDTLFIQIGSLIIGFIVGFIVPLVAPGNAAAVSIAAMALSLIIWLWYITYTVAKYGATPGKMIIGYKIVRTDGSKLTYLRAFARIWAEMLSAIILYIGYMMAGWDKEKRALHDIICDTRVVKK